MSRPPLGPAKRNIDQGAFIRHERRQRLHLILIHLRGKSDAALGREFVVTVNRPPADKSFNFSAFILTGNRTW